MGIFSIRTDRRHIHQEDVNGDVKETELLEVFGSERRERLSTNEEVVGPFSYSSSSGRAESDLSSICKPNQWKSTVKGCTPAPTGSTASVESSFHSACELHMGLNADLERNEGVANIVATDTGVIAQAPETFPTVSAGFSEWDGVERKAGDEEGLAVEDWLDVVEALDAVPEPKPLSVCDKRVVWGKRL